MGSVVVDSSTLVDYLTADTPGRSDRHLEEATELHVPEVCDVEVASAVCRGVRVGALSKTQAMVMLLDYASLPLERHRHLTFLGRIFALRENFSAADAAYVALAERLGADLLTADARLARAVARHTAVRCLP